MYQRQDQSRYQTYYNTSYTTKLFLTLFFSFIFYTTKEIPNCSCNQSANHDKYKQFQFLHHNVINAKVVYLIHINHKITIFALIVKK